MYKKITIIYKILNIKNGKVYIGSSYNGTGRKNNHFWKLRNNKHANKHLQSSFNKYGDENFKFQVLETLNQDVSKQDLAQRENFWINGYWANNKKFGYNKREVAENNKGFHQTDNQKKIMSKRMKGTNNPFYGKRHSLEKKIQMGENRKKSGFWWRPSQELKQQLSESRKGIDNPAAKLNWFIVNDIREKYKDHTQKQLAQEYDVSEGCIQGIVANVTWHDPNYVRIDKLKRNKVN